MAGGVHRAGSTEMSTMTFTSRNSIGGELGVVVTEGLASVGSALS